MIILVICGLQKLVREKHGASVGRLGHAVQWGVLLAIASSEVASSHLLLLVAVQGMDETGQEKEREFYFAVS